MIHGQAENANYYIREQDRERIYQSGSVSCFWQCLAEMFQPKVEETPGHSCLVCACLLRGIPPNLGVRRCPKPLSIVGSVSYHLQPYLA